jgi:hypothetical protein
VGQNLSGLYGPLSDIDEAQLEEWENFACSYPVTVEREVIGRLVAYARHLLHQALDPNRMVKGRPLTRQWHLCLTLENAALRAELTKAQRQTEDLRNGIRVD